MTLRKHTLPFIYAYKKHLNYELILTKIHLREFLSENEPKHKIIRSDTNNKRKRTTDDEHEESQRTTDDEHEEPQRKKVFSNLTNLSTYNTRKNKK